MPPADNDIYTNARIHKADIVRMRKSVTRRIKILYSRSPSKVPILLFRPLTQRPTLLFRALNGDVVMKPRPDEVAQLDGPARPSRTHGHLWPLRKDAEVSGQPEVRIECRGQPIGRPGTSSRGGKSKRGDGAYINLWELRTCFCLGSDDFRGVGA